MEKICYTYFLVVPNFLDLVFIIIIFFLCLFLRERESERDRTQEEKGQRERETQNLKQAPGSQLSAQSPMRGLNLQTVRS